MNEADFATHGLGCTYGRNKVVNCPPAVVFLPSYFFTRYPLETTKVWNLLKLLSPTSWIWTISSILIIVISLKAFSSFGIYQGCSYSSQEITLVPFR